MSFDVNLIGKSAGQKVSYFNSTRGSINKSYTMSVYIGTGWVQILV